MASSVKELEIKLGAMQRRTINDMRALAERLKRQAEHVIRELETYDPTKEEVLHLNLAVVQRDIADLSQLYGAFNAYRWAWCETPDEPTSV